MRGKNERRTEMIRLFKKNISYLLRKEGITMFSFRKKLERKYGMTVTYETLLAWYNNHTSSKRDCLLSSAMLLSEYFEIDLNTLLSVDLAAQSKGI